MPAVNSTPSSQMASSNAAPPMQSTYDYALVHVVPHVARGEYFNAGVILFCRTKRFLGARVQLDAACLHSMTASVDEATLRAHLELIPQICAGKGEIGALPLEERFHWLTTPRSTVIQVSDVHSGLCREPEAVLEKLFHTLVMRR